MCDIDSSAVLCVFPILGCACPLQVLRARRDVVLMAVVRNGHALQRPGSEGKGLKQARKWGFGKH